MKVKYLFSGSRVICDGENHHIFKRDGRYDLNKCSCDTYPNSDPSYWGKRKGCRCPAMDEKKQCQFPELHEGPHVFELTK